MPAHILQRCCVDDVVGVPRPQHGQERLARLRRAGPEHREPVVADLRREPVLAGMPGGGVVYRYPARGGQPGPQHLLVLGHEVLERLGQQAHDLAFGDLDPDPVQQRREPLRRHLPLGVQGQHKAPQLRTEAADDPRRQSSQHRLARRQQPALAPVAHHLGRKPQVAHQDVRVALEARAGRHRRLEHPLGGDRLRVALDAARRLGALLILVGRPGLRRLLHAGRPQWRTGRQPFQPGHLVAQRLVLSAQRYNRRLLRVHPSLQSRIVRVQPPHLTDKAANNSSQLGKRESLQKCCIQQRHAACESWQRTQRNRPARESAPVTVFRSVGRLGGAHGTDGVSGAPQPAGTRPWSPRRPFKAETGPAPRPAPA